MEQTAEASQLAYARFAGLMYFLVLGFDIAGLLIVSSIGDGGNFVETSHRIIASETLYRLGLCCSLVGSLSTILLAIGLYVAVKPVDRNLAMMALLFRVAEAATGAISQLKCTGRLYRPGIQWTVFAPDRLLSISVPNKESS